MANRVKEKLAAGELVTGVITYSPCAELVPTLAAAGFDYIQIDQMFGSVGWSEAANICRAAKLSGITPIIRLQTEPWLMVDNQQLAADAARALSIGFEGITWSVTALAEVARIVAVAGGWHRDLAAMPWTPETFKDFKNAQVGETFIAPIIESPAVLDWVDDLATCPGIDALFCGNTDLTVQLGHGMDADHPDVWEAVNKVKKACEANGVGLWVNPGMGYTTFPSMLDRVNRLVDAGANIILFQTLELLLKMSAEAVLAGTHR